jgi:hypothetical protein
LLEKSGTFARALDFTQNAQIGEWTSKWTSSFGAFFSPASHMVALGEDSQPVPASALPASRVVLAQTLILDLMHMYIEHCDLALALALRF